MLPKAAPAVYAKCKAGMPSADMDMAGTLARCDASPSPDGRGWPDVERRLRICLSCPHLVRDDRPGCSLMRACERPENWEGALRSGRCPKKKWGYSRSFNQFTGEADSKMGDGHFWVIGNPGPVGGANTELWHSIRMWVENGLTPHVVPTWEINREWRDKVHGAGAIVHATTKENILNLKGLAGSTVVSMCNAEFLGLAPALKEAGCKLIWVNCMTWPFDKEVAFCKSHGGFDKWVCQSQYQKDRLLTGHGDKSLSKLGIDEDRLVVIRGAFYGDEFPYGPRPHVPGTDFTFGRLARADKDKWSSNLISIYSSVPYAKKKARLMGWRKEIEDKLGKPPAWMETLEPGKEAAQSFISSLHACVPINGGAHENWPRVGLECLSAGVPLVVQNDWGWKEMLVHGESGLLCSSDEDFAYYIAKLAREEDFRMRIAEGGRKRLAEICNPSTIGAQWKEILFG